MIDGSTDLNFAVWRVVRRARGVRESKRGRERGEKEGERAETLIKEGSKDEDVRRKEGMKNGMNEIMNEKKKNETQAQQQGHRRRAQQSHPSCLNAVFFCSSGVHGGMSAHHILHPRIHRRQQHAARTHTSRPDRQTGGQTA